MLQITTKICFSCNKSFPLTLEYFYKSNQRGLQSECKSCTKIRRSKWWKSPKGKLSSANTKLKARFGIDLNIYNKLLQDQNFECLICKRTKSNIGHKLAVDHDHTNGRIRGLLCKECNIGLGAFRDNIDFLNMAIVYLEKYKGVAS